MLLKEGSEIADPQNAMLRYFNCEHCRARTSVAVSDNAQQKVWLRLVSELNFLISYGKAHITRSSSSKFFAALVRCTIALSVRYVQSAKQSFRRLVNWALPQYLNPWSVIVVQRVKSISSIRPAA